MLTDATVTNLTPGVDSGDSNNQQKFVELSKEEVENLEPTERLEYLNNLIQYKQNKVMDSTYPLFMPSGEDDPNNEYQDVKRYYHSLQRYIQTKLKWGGKSAITNNRYFQFIEVMNIYEWISESLKNRKSDTELIEFRPDLFEILYNLMLHQEGVGYDDAKKYMYLFRPVNNAYKAVDTDINMINSLYQEVAKLNSELNGGMENDVDYSNDDEEYQKSKESKESEEL